MTVKTIKSCNLITPVTIDENASVIEVAKKLSEFQERRVFVVNKKHFPIGIISLVDINDRVVARGKDPKKTKAKDIMTYPINLVVDINDSSEEVLKKMIQKDNYYVPVTEKGVLKGLITNANIMKALKK
jgi:CBS domain-containing protein